MLLNGDAIATAEFAADAAQVHAGHRGVRRSYPGRAVPLELRLGRTRAATAARAFPTS